MSRMDSELFRSLMIAQLVEGKGPFYDFMNSPTYYPGLTSERRVVLDLAFPGYGLSSHIVARSGELLGIADPAA